MVGSSILPVALKNNKLYFLFGKETSLDTTPGYSDFGGGVEAGEDPMQTAYREGGEELTGFLGDGRELEKYIKKNGGYYTLSHTFLDKKGEPNNSYDVHIFKQPYDENLPKYYNANHHFLWDRMNKSVLQKTKLFEKIEIKWFSFDEMRTHKKKFRPFYQTIVEKILSQEKEITKFIKSPKSFKHSKTVKHGKKRHSKTKKVFNV